MVKGGAQMDNIVVAVRAGSGLLEEFQVLEGGLDVDPDYLEHGLSEWDAAAVDAATQLGGQVTVVSVGGPEAEAVLREAVSLGAARAVHIDTAGECEDSLAVARLLAEFVRQDVPDAVLCGVQSSDSGGAAVPAALAGFLNWPAACVVSEAEAAGDRLRVTRELEEGVYEDASLALPAVVSVQSGVYQYKYPSFMAKRKAAACPIGRMTVAELGLSQDELLSIRGAERRFLERPVKSTGVVLDGPASLIAQRILAVVKEALS
jgi:electron transfer flavoprotein beta subunit